MILLNKKKIISFIFYLFLVNITISQEIGNPFIVNFKPSEYNAHHQNWGMAKDSNNYVYFANTDGVLRFDGYRWQKIKCGKNKVVRSIAIDFNNIIYVGCQEDFGILIPNSNGEFEYYSLLFLVNKDDKKFKDVWSINVTKDGVFFRTQNKIFRLLKGKISTYQSEIGFSKCFVYNEKYFVRENGIGIKVFKNNTLQDINNSEFFADKKILNALNINNTCFVLTQNHGFYNIYFDSTFSNIDKIEQVNYENEEELKKSRIYNATIIYDSLIAIGSLNKGLFIYNKKGHLIQSINKNHQLNNQSILYLYFDNNQTIWVCHENGISFFTKQALTWWSDKNNLEGAVLSINRINNKLWVGTTTGLYYFENNNFHSIEEIKSEVWNINYYDNLDFVKSEYIFAGTTYGLYYIKKNKIVNLLAEIKINEIENSNVYKNLIYIATKYGIYTLRINKDKIEKVEKFIEIDADILSIEEDKDGNLWATAANEGIYYLKIDSNSKIIEKQLFTKTNGLPSLYELQVYKYNNTFVFGTEKGLYSYFKTKNKFIPSSKIPYDSLKTIQSFSIDELHRIWLIFNKNNQQQVSVINKKSQFSSPNDSLALKLIPAMSIYSIFHDRNGITWIGGSEGLLRYDPHVIKKYKLFYLATITNVYTELDSNINNGFFIVNADNPYFLQKSIVKNQPENQIYHFTEKNNAIKFYFSSNNFEKKDAEKFSFILENYDKTWSSWSHENSKEYTNLKFGTYVFKVKAQNIYGNTSEIASFKFTIDIPFYFKWYSIVAYFILFIAVIFGVIQLSILRLKKSKLKLENIVKERTKEIEIQKNEIEKKNDILNNAYKTISVKNQNINSSLRYAEKLQQAILPSDERLGMIFKDFFIIYKPKEIVSGDFYWAAYHNNLIFISVIDCTGHGVPGAFMSMVGNTLLNQIILEENISKPSKILELMHLRLTQILKLKEKDIDFAEGMDMSICVINTATNKLLYSGAKRPIFISYNNEIKEYKPTTRSIGGFILSNNDIPFEDHEIYYQKGTNIYMFTDGFTSQMNENQRIFGLKRLEILLSEIINMNCNEQKNQIEYTISNFKGKEEQIDDITFLGFKI